MLTAPIAITGMHLLVAAAFLIVWTVGIFRLGSAWEWARRGHGWKRALIYTRQTLLIIRAAADNGHELDDGHRRGLEKAIARIDREAPQAGGGQ